MEDRALVGMADSRPLTDLIDERTASVPLSKGTNGLC